MGTMAAVAGGSMLGSVLGNTLSNAFGGSAAAGEEGGAASGAAEGNPCFDYVAAFQECIYTPENRSDISYCQDMFSNLVQCQEQYAPDSL